MPTMLILRGIAGHFDGKDWPRGALHEGPALEYATRRGYTGRVLDIAGLASGAPDGRPQVRAALAAIAAEPIEALYGFSGGGYNLVHILARMTPEQRARIKLVVVIGAPEVGASAFSGNWETVYRKDPPGGHMAGPAALLKELGEKNMANETLKMSDRGLNLVKHFESCLEPVGGGQFRAYTDPVGVLTIGWGHTNHHGRKFTSGSVWTQKECDDELASDLALFEAAVQENVKIDLKQWQFDALVSFSYNVGEGNLRSSTLLRKVNAGDFDGAAQEFHRWNKGGGRVLAGLTRRRASESLLFQNVLDTNYDGKADSSAPIPKPDAPSGPPPANQPDFFRAMRAKGIEPDIQDGDLNIVYVAGMNENFTLNADRHNTWSDLRMVLGHDGKVLGKWRATIDPGDHYVKNRINPDGAAQISFGRQTAWQTGLHRGYDALVQTGGPVKVYRDDDEDFSREGDDLYTGYFGINQHHGWDAATPDRQSAGCLVGQSVEGHKNFMAMIRRDRRYKENKRFIFPTTILSASDVLSAAPLAAAPTAPASFAPGWLSKLWSKS